MIMFASAQSVKELINYANNGNVEAAYKLGCLYFSGENVPLDKTIAVEWWKKAANEGNVLAMERLAVCYQNGYGVQADKQQSKYWYDKGAELGNPFCQYYVGKNTLMGLRGYSKDILIAEKFLLLAATNEVYDERVYVRACSTLSMLYRNEIPNADKEFYWLKKAADGAISKIDNIECVEIGQRYISGQIPNNLLNTPDYNQAFAYFSKAAKLGGEDGMFWLGQCYQNAWGVSNNCDSTLHYYKLSAQNNSAKGCWALVDIYLGNSICGNKDVSQALFWYNRTPSKSVEVLVTMGKYYKNNDYAKAFSCFQEAVNKYYESIELHKKYPKQQIVSDDGIKQIAWCYMYGRGIEQNLSQAYSYIGQYLKNHPDDPEAQLYLGEYYMIRNQKDSATTMMNKVLAVVPKSEVENEDLYKYVFDVKGKIRDGKTIFAKISDVDKNIPINSNSNDKTFVVVIANEDYEEVASVPFALNDGKIFASYCQKTLGIPESNIHLVENATLNKLKREIDWLSQVLGAYNGEAKAIFYYAGHGIPDEKNHDAFLLPVDGYGNDIKTGYQISKLYQQLGSIPAKQVVVLMDACFSGAKREGGMLVSARGVAIKVNNSQPTGNMLVLSAAQGDETAYPNNQEGHGMFTYFLLKKLQDTKGNVNLQDLGNYVITNVTQQSVVLNGKSQTPSINISAQVGDSWKLWTLK